MDHSAWKKIKKCAIRFLQYSKTYINPVTPVVALKYFTLANARRFYLTLEKHLGVTLFKLLYNSY